MNLLKPAAILLSLLTLTPLAAPPAQADPIDETICNLPDPLGPPLCSVVEECGLMEPIYPISIIIDECKVVIDELLKFIGCVIEHEGEMYECPLTYGGFAICSYADMFYNHIDLTSDTKQVGIPMHHPQAPPPAKIGTLAFLIRTSGNLGC